MKVRTAQPDRTAILWPQAGLIGHRLPELNPWKLGRFGEFSCFRAAATYHDLCRVRNVDRYASVHISLDRIEARAVEPPVEAHLQSNFKEARTDAALGAGAHRRRSRGRVEKMQPLTDGVRPLTETRPRRFRSRRRKFGLWRRYLDPPMRRFHRRSFAVQSIAGARARADSPGRDVCKPVQVCSRSRN